MVKKEKDEYFICIYEANSCEYKNKIENFGKENKEQLIVKTGKKIKVFI